MVFGTVSGLGVLQSTIALVVTAGVALAAVRFLGQPVVNLVGVGGSVSSVSTETVGSAPPMSLNKGTDADRIVIEQQYDEVPERIERKREQYPRAIEIQDATGFCNVDALSIGDYIGDKVILIEFWTFGCYNCQNSHSKIQNFWRTYKDDALLVIGIHYPEFDREREPANVSAYLKETDTTYPVVLDNDGGTWDAYDQRYWPARYLIDVDGFIRYFHAGEGAYEETNTAIQQLLEERNRVRRQTASNVS
jgi:thiol-disulfide isomerase/thioredoxin